MFIELFAAFLHDPDIKPIDFTGKSIRPYMNKLFHSYAYI